MIDADIIENLRGWIGVEEVRLFVGRVLEEQRHHDTLIHISERYVQDT